MTDTLKVQALGVEYILLPVATTEAGAAIDPTANPVQAALVPLGTALSLDAFVDAEWETDDTTTPATYAARVKVGPADADIAPAIEVTAQLYGAYSRVTDSDEAPVLFHGYVEFV